MDIHPFILQTSPTPSPINSLFSCYDHHHFFSSIHLVEILISSRFPMSNKVM
uniref:Uncharacterized protein n=1 Tax=Lepeophtheirus salmonis TaxID=72036 RepID=A0A0K2TL97_LEPSM